MSTVATTVVTGDKKGRVLLAYSGGLGAWLEQCSLSQITFTPTDIVCLASNRYFAP